MSERVILLVEDDPVQANFWALRLRGAGYHVITAGSAEQAVQAIANRHFHLAVVDQSLVLNERDDTSGLDKVVRYLKQQIDNQTLPSIAYLVLTAYPDVEALKKAFLDLRVFHYVIKDDPGADVLLLEKIGEALETITQCNFELDISCHGGVSLDGMFQDLDFEGCALTDEAKASGIHKEMRDLLGKLFQDSTKIEIFPLVKGYSGAGVALVLPYQIVDGRQRSVQWVVVKYGAITRMHEGFERHAAYAGLVKYGKGPTASKFRRTRHLGGVVYSYVGVPLRKAQDFDALYSSQDANAVSLVLDDLFSETLGPFYSDPPPKNPVDFDKLYLQRLCRRPAKVQKGFERTFPAARGWKKICLNEFRSREFSTFLYELSELQFPAFVGYDRLITHGDLNGRNILIYDGKTWLIDFDHSGPGHIFCDFVKLETHIKFYLIKTENLEALDFFEDVLNEPDPSLDGTTFADWEDADDLCKACQTILQLRDWARTKAMQPSWSTIRDEYYAALFYQTLVYLGYDSVSRIRKKHVLLSANKIYDLLKMMPTV